MQEQVDKLLIKIDYLEKIVNTQQQYLMLSWTILAVIVGVLAFTMFFLIKSIVNDRVEKELVVIRQQMQMELEKYIDKKPHVQYRAGTLSKSIYFQKFRLTIDKLKNGTIDFPNRFELFTVKGNKALEFDAFVESNDKNCTIVMSIYNFDPKTDGDIRWVLTEYII